MQLLLDVLRQRASSTGASDVQDLVPFNVAVMNLNYTLAGIIQALSRPQDPTTLQTVLSSLLSGSLVLQNTVPTEVWQAICTINVSQGIPKLPPNLYIDPQGSIITKGEAEQSSTTGSSSSTTHNISMSTSQISDRCPESFPQKLFRIVTDAETSGKGHLIGFAEPAGLALRNAGLFAREILPKYFRHNKLASFKRQLHNYGFEMMHGVYHHENFQRGRPDLLNRVRRKLQGRHTDSDIEDVLDELREEEEMEDTALS